jgi:hypothetical protein
MHRFLLRLIAERCLDGVELVHRDIKPGVLELKYGVSGTVWFTHRSDRCQRETVRDMSGLEDTVVVRFVNATDDDKRITFMWRFGLPFPHIGVRSVSEHRPSIPSEFISGAQRELRLLLARAGSGDAAVAMEAANRSLVGAGGLHLSMVYNDRMVIAVHDVLDFMHIEVAMVAASGARLARCESCNDMFLTGPLTNRRSTARYCRDRCRVNAHRTKTNRD